jgi:hypothetical protein
MSPPTTIEIGYDVSPGAVGVPCPCGGYGDRVDCTPEELARWNCGRSYECCARAFVCRVCKSRLVGTAEAPEME